MPLKTYANPWKQYISRAECDWRDMKIVRQDQLIQHFFNDGMSPNWHKLCSWWHPYHRRFGMAKEWEFEAIVCDLTAADEPRLDTFVTQHGGTPADVLTDITTRGYKISLVWVDSSNSFVFTVTSTKNMKVNAKKFLSTWSDDPVEAIWMALYKMDVIYDGGEWESRGRSGRWG